MNNEEKYEVIVEERSRKDRILDALTLGLVKLIDGLFVPETERFCKEVVIPEAVEDYRTRHQIKRNRQLYLENKE